MIYLGIGDIKAGRIRSWGVQTLSQYAKLCKSRSCWAFGGDSSLINCRCRPATWVFGCSNIVVTRPILIQLVPGNSDSVSRTGITSRGLRRGESAFSSSG